MTDSRSSARPPEARAVDARPQQSRFAVLRPLGLVLLAAIAMIGLAWERGLIPWNSDMAMVGLMAEDILHRGAHPVFFQGSEYGGTLEQFYLASVFAVFPESVATHRAAIALLLILVICLVWQFTRAAFGSRAALAAGLYLALGPPFFFYRGLTSEGPYTPIYLIGAAILVLLLRIEAKSRAGRPASLEILAVGLLGGLGWWTHPLVIVFAGCTIAALLIGSARRRLTVWAVGGALCAVIVGAAPWLVRNMHSGWASVIGPEFARATPFQTRQELGLLVREGLPVLLGGRSMWASAALFPGSVAIAYLAFALMAGFGVRLATSRRDGLERYSAGILVALILITPALAIAAKRADLQEPRLLFPMYLAIAPLFGALLASRGVSRWLKGGLCGGVAVLHVIAHAEAPRFEPPPAALVRDLSARQIHDVYASYWLAYRVTFLSGGDVVGTPFGSINITRRPLDRIRVDASPSPGFVLDKEEAERFESFLRIRAIAYRRESLGQFALFTGLPAAALEQFRKCECIPSSPRRVSWVGMDGPHRVASGSTARFRVRVRNDASEAWSPAMNLSYHWMRPNGSVAVLDGLRTRGFRSPGPGELLDQEITVESNVPPGRYVLVVDVVEENIAWLADRGVPPLKYDVEVF